MISTLFQKWKNQKLPNPNWNFLVIACRSFCLVSVSKLSVCVSQIVSFFILSHSSFYTSSGGRWVSSSLWSNGPRLPSLSTLSSSPLLSKVRLCSPLSSGFFSFPHLCPEVLLLPSREWVYKICLAQSLASGCLTRGLYPNAEKGNLIKSDSVLEFSLVLFLINSIINAHERLRQTKLKQAFHLEISHEITSWTMWNNNDSCATEHPKNDQTNRQQRSGHIQTRRICTVCQALHTGFSSFPFRQHTSGIFHYTSIVARRHHTHTRLSREDMNMANSARLTANLLIFTAMLSK